MPSRAAPPFAVLALAVALAGCAPRKEDVRPQSDADAPVETAAEVAARREAVAAALAEPSDDLGRLLHRGWEAYYAEELSDAADAFRRAVDLDAGAAEAHAGLGWTLLREGSAEAAAARLEHALQLDPDDGAALAGLAQARRDLGDVDAAVELWERMAARYPGAHSGVQGLAEVHVERGDCAAALPHLELLERARPSPWARRELARCRAETEPRPAAGFTA